MKKKKRKVSDIQSVIMLALSLMTVTTSIFIGLLLYNRYETAMRHNDVSNTQNMMESIVSSTEQYLKSMSQMAQKSPAKKQKAFSGAALPCCALTLSSGKSDSYSACAPHRTPCALRRPPRCPRRW